ncbi:tetratricopeptide repeat protein [Lawsonia intracellularis]|uniref:NA n=1 Tax=Lawsonia intracellularis (strain PHE/MN1-00) TaxID=363253 RepID=Q1MQX9_LAWIP|nr:tetratricopeptide repeat protein [Lawsonia intracellularis]AGC49959.1 hypothetical protein LAW_00560 [Lawsonia intracellularis N343]KAA0205456.1 tetratricopeptide repeat-containing protein [Lawsonia intracellularis]MBZ3892001.1 tetratricopeptide repeat protein [Lawsonia intracellularis]RBN31995.1 tetratricopeptide repeat protein [Lawsonia intracellularis]RBN33562.1 tetratricopeptide repeat protein [Lawsonia intracellularis]
MLSEYQVKRLLDTANTACHYGLVGVARKIYDGVLALKPGFPPALIGQALSHIVIDEFSEAEEILTKYLEKVPDDPDAQVFLGITYMFTGRGDQSSLLFEKVAATDGAASVFAVDLLEVMKIQLQS